MALLKILFIPDPRLREQTEVITDFKDPELQQLIDDMIETMYHAHGVGLAATQVGISKRVAVIDVSDTRDKPMVLINPEIVERSNMVSFQEGCLSVPGHYDHLERANKVKLKAFDRDGKPYELEAEDLFAECIQHEIDHLYGKLYIDYLSPFKQSRIREKVSKLIRKSQKK
ncbi:MAG: peptide deformylase [Gammaproteobacteria bacterium]